jgi:hypothetical protein
MTHHHVIAGIAVWAGMSAFLAAMALLAAHGRRTAREHSARIARYQEATWEGARDALGLPPSWDEFVVNRPRAPENPKTPQRGGDHA